MSCKFVSFIYFCEKLQFNDTLNKNVNKSIYLFFLRTIYCLNYYDNICSNQSGENKNVFKSPIPGWWSLKRYHLSNHSKIKSIPISNILIYNFLSLRKVIGLIRRDSTNILLFLSKLWVILSIRENKLNVVTRYWILNEFVLLLP